ncbi:uncharacterized protein LOC143888778 [Tasmannia lanceolata]|uniref:uncharacterized protein LOC143888778 n=1 Tax=Tasmannia lanceolata TaxID=3420 RepID=UPI0040648C86
MGDMTTVPNIADFYPMFKRFDLQGLKKKAFDFIDRASSIWEVSRLELAGAAKGNPGESGGGGVMRDAKAKVIFAFAFFYGTSTNMVAEARALLDGLRLCKAFGFKNFVVESDSKVLMDFISKKGSHPWSISFFWPEIIDLMDFMGPHHQHQFREGNQVADALANEACKSRSHQIFHGWSEMPRIARGAARCDTNGFPNIRPSK